MGKTNSNPFNQCMAAHCGVLFQPESKPLAQFEEHSNNCRGTDAEVLGIKLIIASVSTKRLRFWAAFHGWKSWLEAKYGCPLGSTNIAGWKTTIFNRKYIFNPGPSSSTMLVYVLPECIWFLLSRCLFYMGRTSEPRVKYHLWWSMTARALKN